MIVVKCLLVAAATAAGLLWWDREDQKEPEQPRREQIVESLMQRNAELEAQVSAGQSVVSTQSTALVVMGCGLAVCVVLMLRQRRKGVACGRSTQPPPL